MKIREFANDDAAFKDLLETASAGSTAAGNIASFPGAMGAVNRRPSLFGYIPVEQPKRRKRGRKSS